MPYTTKFRARRYSTARSWIPHSWRERCTNYANIPRYKTGDVIKLGQPIKLGDGAEIKVVKKQSYFHRGKNHSNYVDTETGHAWRLKRAHFAGSTLQGVQKTRRRTS